MIEKFKIKIIHWLGGRVLEDFPIKIQNDILSTEEKARRTILNTLFDTYRLRSMPLFNYKKKLDTTTIKGVAWEDLKCGDTVYLDPGSSKVKKVKVKKRKKCQK